jgi:hypothetical protein
MFVFSRAVVGYGQASSSILHDIWRPVLLVLVGICFTPVSLPGLN